MRAAGLLGVLFSCAVLAAPVRAQTGVDAKWIWVDDGSSLTDSKPGKAWFRREVRSDEPSTGVARVACDDAFTLWVNGQKVGSGQARKPYRFSLNGIAEFGPNVIAVEVDNAGGRAGLLVDGEVRSQGGRAISFDTGPDWKASTKQPAKAWLDPKLEDASFKPVRVIGPHAQSAWKDIVFGESYLDRYQLAAGFDIVRIAEPQLVGSLISMTWGNRGRLLVSRENGPILSLVDTDNDGTFDKVVEFSTEMKNTQGLCMVGEELYAVGTGPQGTGMYRLIDRDHDDVADGLQLVTGYKGPMGEHGPHDVVFGPDGQLYNNVGNHAWITHTPEVSSPIRKTYEGDLLHPRFEDPNGHAAGIPAPGGTIWRFSPDGQHWWLTTNGFRNCYDFAINSHADIVAFDSDMEWEIGMPFYKPVRVTHCTPGAEFGWRSGDAKWPPYYLDSLPAAVNVGRGSPTGVMFYEHNQFPAKYRGAYIACDWSMGRILAVYLKPDGATLTGKFDTLVSGNPLNVSDIDVDRDGTVVFCTGGRGTEGGVYRLTYRGEGAAKPMAASAETLADLVKLPQPMAAWNREAAIQVKNRLGDKWEPGLRDAALKGSPEVKIRALTLLSQQGPRPKQELLIKLTADKDAGVRAFAAMLLGYQPSAEAGEALVALLDDSEATVQRRACEALVAAGLPAPVKTLIKLIGSKDRFLRFSARLAMERLPVEDWRAAALKSDNVLVVNEALLALYRLGPSALSPAEALEQETTLLQSKLSDEDRIDVLRNLELTLQAGATTPANGKVAKNLLAVFPYREDSKDAHKNANLRALNFETAQLLAYLQVPEAAEKFVVLMEKSPTQAEQIHYALVSSYLKKGWTFDLKTRVLNWYDGTKDWEGGHSFPRWLENIITVHLDHLTPDERADLLATWSKRPFATRLLVRQSQPQDIRDYEKTLAKLLSDVEGPSAATHEEVVAMAIDALAKSKSDAAQQQLRALYDQNPDRREQLARVLAAAPRKENWPYLIRSLQTGDPTTLQLCIKGLRDLNGKPDKPEETRQLIVAGLRLGDQGGLTAVTLLEQWTGSPFDHKQGVHAALAHYQEWFKQKYPSEPLAELPKEAEGSKYTFDQVLQMIADEKKGDPAKGKVVFTKANCLKCHRFVNEGQGVGPDLTTARKRFQRKEIVESVLFPSQVISDQYRSVTVQTVDGLIHTGMPTTQPDNSKVVLLLQDATRIEIPKQKIDTMEPAKKSVMPEGLLKDLSPEEIVDLFAFLETSKNNEGPATPTAAAAK